LEEVYWQNYQIPGGTAPPVRLVVRNTYNNEATISPSRGRLTTVESFDDNGRWLQTRALEYGGLNARLSREVNTYAGWLAGSTALTAPIQYDYDNTYGFISKTTYPEGPAGKGGAFSTTQVYSNGALTELWDTVDYQEVPRQPSKAQARVTYGPAGNIESIATAGSSGHTTIQYDDRNRPAAITGGVWNGTRWTYESGSYTYDGAGNIWSIGHNRYGYDGANRLVEAKVFEDSSVPSSTLRRQTFVYDAFGNMTEKYQFDLDDIETSYDLFTVTAQTSGWNYNRILSHQTVAGLNVFTYDARGNLLTADGRNYVYGSRNRLASLRNIQSNGREQELARYEYDSGAHRIRKEDRIRGSRTFYVRDGQGRLLSEFVTTQRNDNNLHWTKHSLYLGDRLVALRENMLPAPPAGLKATPQGTTSITLTWQANPTGEGVTLSHYKVYRSPTTSTSWSLRGSPTGTSFSDSVQKGTWYKYVVTAVDNQIRESYSSDEIVSRAATFNSRPNAPAGVVAVPGNGLVTLSWTANPPSQNVLGYNVYRGIAGGPLTLVPQSLLAHPSFVDENLINETVYQYSVSAVNSLNLESIGNMLVSATPDDYTPPAPPLGLRAFAACDGSSKVLLSWQLNAATDFAEYQLWRDPAFTSGTFVAMGMQNGYQDSDTTHGTLYTYWVKAVDADGNLSEESLRVQVKTRPLPGTVPVPPRPVVKAEDSTVTLRLRLNTTPADINVVRVYRKPNVDLACDQYLLHGETTILGAQEYIDRSVLNNLAYDYAVTFVDTQNRESAFSPAALAIPVGAPWSQSECYEEIPWTVPGDHGHRDWLEGVDTCVSDQNSGPWRRWLMRWQEPAATKYQPINAAGDDGALGYLVGYRVYEHYVANPGLSRRPLKVDGGLG
jgi:fibronectin type 3 domain-containing protein